MTVIGRLYPPEREAVRFADESGRVWRLALDPERAETLRFTALDATGHATEVRRLYDYPAYWLTLDTHALRELLAHTELSGE